MGITSAIGTGLSVVSGISQIGQQKRQAAAQKQMLDKQDAQQKLQSQLQLFSLQNQRKLDSLNDQLTDASIKSAYMQTDASLKAAEHINQLNTANAIFSAQVQKGVAGATKQQSDIKSDTFVGDAKVQAANASTANFAEANQEEQGTLNSILQNIAQGGNSQQALSSLLSLASSSGGINEALQLLSEQGTNDAVVAGAQASRAGELTKAKRKQGNATSEANIQLAQAQANQFRAGSAFEQQSTNYQSDASILDATTAARVTGEGFLSKRASNQSNYNISNESNALQRSSRYLTSMANEEALQQGQQLSSDTIAAQKSTIRSPGFFDYAGVGFNSYNTYNQLSQQPRLS